jgi:hypothetical protein
MRARLILGLPPFYLSKPFITITHIFPPLSTGARIRNKKMRARICVRERACVRVGGRAHARIGATLWITYQQAVDNSVDKKKLSPTLAIRLGITLGITIRR